MVLCTIGFGVDLAVCEQCWPLIGLTHISRDAVCTLSVPALDAFLALKIVCHFPFLVVHYYSILTWLVLPARLNAQKVVMGVLWIYYLLGQSAPFDVSNIIGTILYFCMGFSRECFACSI